MLQKNLNKWAVRLQLWEVEWGISHSQATFWLQKQKSAKHTLIFTNWIAAYDFAHSSTSSNSWEYYYRRLNETRLQWEWYRFFALWQRLKWQQKLKNILLYTDVFEDYPLIRHLSKKTNEFYSVGWYPGIISNRRKLLKLRYSYLLGKTELSVLPSIVILFSTFYPISHQFLKELSLSNVYSVLFVSLSDYRNMWGGSYTIFMTKNYINYYYYYYLVYRAFYGDLVTLGYQQSNLINTKQKKLKYIKKNKKDIRRKKHMRSRVWKQQLKLYWYRTRELKLQKKQKFWKSYLKRNLLKIKYTIIKFRFKQRFKKLKKISSRKITKGATKKIKISKTRKKTK